MRFSEETIDLILDIKEYSGGKIRNEFELSALIEFTIQKQNRKAFDDIVFKAKFLKGLNKVLSGITDNNESREKLLSEYSGELNTLIELIKNSISDTDPLIVNSFSLKFFELNPDCLMNLNLFIEDLSACKDYFNDNKFNSVQ